MQALSDSITSCSIMLNDGSAAMVWCVDRGKDEDDEEGGDADYNDEGEGNESNDEGEGQGNIVRRDSASEVLKTVKAKEQSNNDSLDKIGPRQNWG